MHPTCPPLMTIWRNSVIVPSLLIDLLQRNATRLADGYPRLLLGVPACDIDAGVAQDAMRHFGEVVDAVDAGEPGEIGEVVAYLFRRRSGAELLQRGHDEHRRIPGERGRSVGLHPRA